MTLFCWSSDFWVSLGLCFLCHIRRVQCVGFTYGSKLLIEAFWKSFLNFCFVTVHGILVPEWILLQSSLSFASSLMVVMRSWTCGLACVYNSEVSRASIFSFWQSEFKAYVPIPLDDKFYSYLFKFSFCFDMILKVLYKIKGYICLD